MKNSKLNLAASIALLLLPSQALRAQSLPPLKLMYPDGPTEGSPWEGVPSDSIAWLVRRTYTIDPGAKGNETFRSGTLTDLMCESVRRGRISAFSAETDSFTVMLTFEQAMAVTGRLQHNKAASRIRIIEDLVGRKHQGKPYRCIIGIAPELRNRQGTWEPLFWIYFPELKPQLALSKVSSKTPVTWAAVFGQRTFTPRLVSAADTLRYP